MSKQLNFQYKDINYTLEFTRRSVEQMEREGFVAEDITTKPMIMLPTLFAGAFKANHRFVKPEVINEIYSKMPDKAGLISNLAEMYRDTLSSLFDEPADGAENLTWTRSR